MVLATYIRPSDELLIAGSGLGLVFVLTLLLPAIYPRTWVRVLCFFPSLCAVLVCIWLFVRIETAGTNASLYEFSISLLKNGTRAVLPIALSVVSDVVAIYLIRKTFAAIADTVTALGVIKRVLILIAIPIVATGVPFGLSYLVDNIVGWFALGALSTLNESTSVFALFACATVGFLTFHKLGLDLLARFAYAHTRGFLFADRKFVRSIGCLFLCFALNLEKIAWKSVVELLK